MMPGKQCLEFIQAFPIIGHVIIESRKSRITSHKQANPWNLKSWISQFLPKHQVLLNLLITKSLFPSTSQAQITLFSGTELNKDFMKSVKYHVFIGVMPDTSRPPVYGLDTWAGRNQTDNQSCRRSGVRYLHQLLAFVIRLKQMDLLL